MSTTLISILGGLGGMLGWGVSDFFANEASDKVGHTRAFFWSQIAGLVLVGLFAIFLSRGLAQFSPVMVLLIIVSGIAYSLGYLFFYSGFEIGNVSVVSAVINLQTLFIVSISYFVSGQKLSTLQVPALALLFIGVTLVSVNFKELFSGKASLVKGVKETFIAAILFGIFYAPLSEYILERTDWIATTFGIKLVAIVFVWLITRVTKRSLIVPKSIGNIKKLLIAVGVLEAIAVISVNWGVTYGDLIIVSPVSSALTIVTIILAMIFLKEKISRTQGAGIILAISGIILAAF